MNILIIILIQGLIFGGLIFLLRHFMKMHISGAVGHLQKLNDELVKQQVELKRQIADGHKEYETKMAKLQQEIITRQAAARDEALKTLEDSKSRALQEREKIINEAVETREKMRQEVMAEMEEKAIQYSKDVIAGFLSGDLRSLIQNHFAKDVLEGLKEMQIQQFQVDGAVAQLRVAEPLGEDVKKKIQQVLKEKFKKDVQLKEEIQPELVSGLILRFGTLVIDGSLQNRLQETTARLRKETARRYQGTL